MSSLIDALREIVVANRILAHEDVVDAFGHVSIRHPENPGHYLMARSRSPELVTMDDIMEFTLEGDVVGDDDRKPYAERHIHGAIYEARADVASVVHNHSHAVIPFSVTAMPLRPLMHVTGVIGENVPVWDIEDNFGSTSLLVTNMEQGRDLAKTMAIYTQVNAKQQLQAMPLGEIKFLSPEEIERTPETLIGPLAMERAWEYFARRAMGAEF